MTVANKDIEFALCRLVTSVRDEMVAANGRDEVESVFLKYGLSINEESPIIPVTRSSKILVIGDIRGKRQDFILTASKLGISKDILVFKDFNQAKMMSAEGLRYSATYSDIIVGAVPHMIKDLDGNNSLLSLFDNLTDKEAYPNVVRAETKSGELKLSLAAFKKALRQTRYLNKLA